MQVAGASSVDLGGEEIDVVGADNKRATAVTDSNESNNMRISALLPMSVNPDPTINKATLKSLSTTA